LRLSDLTFGQLVERFGLQNIKENSPLAFFNAVFRKSSPTTSASR
jgi:hypothetical protein